SSGLMYFDGLPWSFNDSAGKPELYRINSADGSILQTVLIKNATNVDWEDITQDDEFIYIGDFGNNAGNRKNLAIYKIKKNQVGNRNRVSITAELIRFSYADQLSFGEMGQNHNFDCESFISYYDSLILFTKNREDRKTRMYKLPKEAGNYSMVPECTFAVDGLVTGADYSIINKELVFIGIENKKPFVFIFKNFNGKKLGTEEVFRINLPRWTNSQTEGICYFDENTLLISTEQTKTFQQAIFILNIREVFKNSGIDYK
ncbi:MAG: hypothetical protein R2750_07630, partial [Bacteroidales bacterium]